MIIDFAEAVKHLQSEQVVALPTETVYGLAACYDSPCAVRQVFTLKERPLDHPLIVHVHNRAAVQQLARELPAYVERLLEHFWPGPLTLVMKKHAHVNDMITAGQDTVAVRMPNHPLFLQVLKELNNFVVAPSANKFTQTSPTCAQHVLQGLGDNVAVLDGGACSVGLESTIVLATNPEKMVLLRPGMIDRAALEAVAAVACVDPSNEKVKTAGQHEIHYQPSKPLYVFKKDDELLALNQTNKKYAVMAQHPLKLGENFKLIMMPKTAQAYAQQLYACWQRARYLEIDAILLQLPPYQAEWYAIHERIAKASQGALPNINAKMS